MLPTGTNQIQFSQLSVELGYGATSPRSLAPVLTIMQESGNPDRIHECHGYDNNDWAGQGGKPEGWINASVNSPSINNGVSISVEVTTDNRSQVNSQSFTMYWRINISSSSPSSYIASGSYSCSISAASYDYESWTIYDSSFDSETMYYMWLSVDGTNWEPHAIEMGA